MTGKGATILSMKRTTIDIPDQLFKKMKTKAIEEDVTMKAFLLKIIQRALENTSATPESENIGRKILKTRKKKKIYSDSEINKLRDELLI
jgi:hypothetical protein